MQLITIGADIKRSEIPPSKSHPNYPIHDIELIEKVTKKLLKHLFLGQLKGPYPLNKLPKHKYKIHLSPIAAKLKPSGKAMILVDESAPQNDNINSAINPKDKTVKYSTFLQLCELLLRIGNRGWIWIVDAVDAYYRIPIQERFHHLFGIKWLNKILIYKCLSFGLSTAPSIYNKFADLILWACVYWNRPLFKCNKSFNILHYLDDFFGGSSSFKTAQQQMQALVKLFEKLNIPTNPTKCVGPAQIADILGWKCCTIPKLAIGITVRKCTKYTNFIIIIEKAKFANLKEFERLIGFTQHTCQIYTNAQCFIRGFTKQKWKLEADIKKQPQKFNKFKKIALSPESLFDLKIWHQLFNDAKTSMLDLDFILKPKSLKQITVYTDASTSYGAGGYTSTNDLFHLPWVSLKISKTNYFSKIRNNQNIDIKEYINYLELFALVFMALQHAKKWKNAFITFWCDNMTAVKAAQKGTIKFKSPLYYQQANLVKVLASLAIKYQFKYECKHIEGKKNIIADTLSRENEYKRQLVYTSFQKSYNVPFKLASKLIDQTCHNKFCPLVKL